MKKVYCWALVLLVVFMLSGISESSNQICTLYLAPSTIQGIGVFAGRAYENGSYINEDPALTLESQFESDVQLNNYANFVFGKDIISFGPSMIYNHSPDNHVSIDLDPIKTAYDLYVLRSGIMVLLGGIIYFYFLSPGVTTPKLIVCVLIFYLLLFINPFPGLSPINQLFTAHTIGPTVGFSINKPIAAGAEIFNNYGTGYFMDRGYIAKSVEPSEAVRTLEELQTIGECISKTYIAASKIPSAGRGVFAAVDIPVGGLIEVTPALVHHRDVITAGRSLLTNYVIVSGHSNVTLLPYGRIGTSCSLGILYWLLMLCVV